MNTDLIFKIFIYGCAVFLSIFQGNAAVYLFNRMPAEWLCDYDEDPSEELMRRDVQRVKSMPWKYIFSMLFVVLNMTLIREDLQFALASSFTLWLLLELAIADVKYNILPDQLIILLAVCSVGFIPYKDGVWEILSGGLIAFVIIFVIALMGKLCYRKNTMGGGDIKLFTAIGLICGSFGSFFILMGSYMLLALHAIFLLIYAVAKPKYKLKKYFPMAPYIAIITTIYLIFFWDIRFR